MQFDKSQVLDMLRQQGDDDKATEADKQLPDTVDTDQHGDLLSKLGLSPQTLISKLAGGSGGGGIGGLLGG